MSEEAYAALVLGLSGAGIVAFLLGRLYQRVVGARAAYKTTKASVPVLRKLMWALIRGFATKAGFAVFVVVLLLIGGARA